MVAQWGTMNEAVRFFSWGNVTTPHTLRFI